MDSDHNLFIGELKLASPLVLAPLAGYSIPPFRLLCRRLGAALTFTEMISAAGLVRSNRNTTPLLEVHVDEKPVGVQLFGAKADEVAEAGKRVALLGFPLIDLNMGCPVQKVVRTGAGAGLLRDVTQAVQVAKALVKAVEVPVAVKTRIGWDREMAHQLIPRLIDVGVGAVTVHGRLREQGFAGKADWAAIHRCRLSAKGQIPIFGSGDLFSADRCTQILEQGYCDGIQLARGAMANPWLFREVEQQRAGKTPEPPKPGEIRAACFAILDWLEARLGPTRSSQIFRSFFCQFVKGRPGAGTYRRQVYLTTTPAAQKELLNRIFPTCSE